jgi:hypothetical protein
VEQIIGQPEAPQAHELGGFREDALKADRTGVTLQLVEDRASTLDRVRFGAVVRDLGHRLLDVRVFELDVRAGSDAVGDHACLVAKARWWGASVDDLPISVCAVLLAEACNVGS